MSYFLDLLEEERATLRAEGNTGALHHRSMNQSALPAIRLYPVAPAQGTAGAAAAAVWQSSVPGVRAVSRAITFPGNAPDSPSPSSSSSVVRDIAMTASTKLREGVRAGTEQMKEHSRGASAAATFASYCFPHGGAPGQPSVNSPDDVLIASSTATMLEAFLLQEGFTPGTVVLLPGILLAPFHNLVNVLQSFGAALVPFDVDIDSMEADVEAVRANLTHTSKSTANAARPLMLLVGIRGRFFRNANALYALANEAKCAVVSVRGPTVTGSAGVPPSPAATLVTTPLQTTSLHIISFDGPGSIGGAIACSPQPDVTSAVRDHLRSLPVAGALTSWMRVARHLCNVLLSDRLDYGSTMWMLALVSRAARGATELAVGAVSMAMGVSSSPSKAHKHASKADAEDAPTAMDAARQEAMDWLYDWFAGSDAPYSASAKHGDGSGNRTRTAAVKAVAQAASAVTRQATTAASDANKPATATSTSKSNPREKLVSPLLSTAKKVSSSLADAANAVSPSTTAAGGIPAPSSTRMTPAAREWLRRLVKTHRSQQDAELLCFWYFLYSLPSYIRVVSAGEGHTPLACVEAGVTSVVLRAECPALVVRRLQQQGFAALPARPVAFSATNGRTPSSVYASPVSGVLYFTACPKSAAAARQLCFVPLSPVMTPTDHQLLVDLLSEMPRRWMTREPQPVSTVTTGQYRRTDGKNFSNADRPYNTPEVRALLRAVSQRHRGTAAGTGAGEHNDGDLDRQVKEAMKKLHKGGHPVFTYLMYGTTAARLLVAKI